MNPHTLQYRQPDSGIIIFPHSGQIKNAAFFLTDELILVFITSSTRIHMYDKHEYSIFQEKIQNFSFITPPPGYRAENVHISRLQWKPLMNKLLHCRGLASYIVTLWNDFIDFWSYNIIEVVSQPIRVTAGKKH